MDDEKAYALYEKCLFNYKNSLQDFLTENEFSLTQKSDRREFLSAREDLAKLASAEYRRLCDVEMCKPVLDISHEIYLTARHFKPGSVDDLDEVLDHLKVDVHAAEAFNIVKYVSSLRRLTKKQKQAVEEYKHVVCSYINEFRDELEGRSEVEMKKLAHLACAGPLQEANVPLYLVHVAYTLKEFIGSVVEMDNPRGWTERVDKVVGKFSSKIPIEKLTELCRNLGNDGNANL